MAVKVPEMLAGSVSHTKETFPNIGGVAYHLYRRNVPAPGNFIMTVYVNNDQPIDGWSATNAAGQVLEKAEGYVALCRFLHTHKCLSVAIDSES